MNSFSNKNLIKHSVICDRGLLVRANYAWLPSCGVLYLGGCSC